MYLQEYPSNRPSEEESGHTEDPTNPDESTHLTMVHKPLSPGTEDTSDIDKVLSISCHVNAHHTYQFAYEQPCLPQHQLVNSEASAGLAVSDMRTL